MILKLRQYIQVSTKLFGKGGGWKKITTVKKEWVWHTLYHRSVQFYGYGLVYLSFIHLLYWILIQKISDLGKIFNLYSKFDPSRKALSVWVCMVPWFQSGTSLVWIMVFELPQWEKAETFNITCESSQKLLMMLKCYWSAFLSFGNQIYFYLASFCLLVAVGFSGARADSMHMCRWGIGSRTVRENGNVCQKWLELPHVTIHTMFLFLLDVESLPNPSGKFLVIFG